jgi:hypothetical protein
VARGLPPENRSAASCPDRWIAECNDDINILRDEFARQGRGTLTATFGPNEMKANVASLFPPDCPHVTPERLGKYLKDISRVRSQHSDRRHLRLRLRAHSKRPGRRAANLGGFSLYGETVLLGEYSSVLDMFSFERSGHKKDDLKIMQFTGLKDKNGKEI